MRSANWFLSYPKHLLWCDDRGPGFVRSTVVASLLVLILSLFLEKNPKIVLPGHLDCISSRWRFTHHFQRMPCSVFKISLSVLLPVFTESINEFQVFKKKQEITFYCLRSFMALSHMDQSLSTLPDAKGPMVIHLVSSRHLLRFRLLQS
ncbi:hypothetical protein Bca101_065723 [Brassica carinata]